MRVDVARGKGDGECVTAQQYNFQIQTPNGVAQINVPLDDFKQCQCGSTLFEVRYRVAWVRPHGLIGAPPICFKAEIYLCSSCGNEIGPDEKTVRDSKTAGNGTKSKPKTQWENV